ncbi:hypothetical protein [Intestinibacillus massiliensis]|uniref:hypothetical protein n=1 Tax=Intestinibacillus massiliensis TaxID=1871029 RepID=UPI00117AB7EE|nr:hypothetical protein [Intestinibacillus massiliensis]
MTEIEKAITAFEAVQEDEGNPILTFGTLKFFAVAEPACKEALAALREKQERDVNPPLTLEELRGMDGEPVYLVGMEPIEYGWRNQYLLIDTDEDLAYNGSYQFDLSRCAGFAYRRPPEGDDR